MGILVSYYIPRHNNTRHDFFPGGNEIYPRSDRGCCNSSVSTVERHPWRKNETLTPHHSAEETLHSVESTSVIDNEKSAKGEVQKGFQIDDQPRQNSIVSVHYAAEDDAPKSRLVEIDHSIPVRPWKRRYALWTTNGANPPTYEWWRHLYQPFALLFIFPAIAFAAIQWAFCISALSLLAVSSSNLFPLPPYNFSATVILSASSF
jgi:hypothetical protein